MSINIHLAITAIMAPYSAHWLEEVCVYLFIISAFPIFFPVFYIQSRKFRKEDA